MLERSGEWSVIWAPRSFARIVTAAVLISRLPKASKAHTANYQRTANVAGHTTGVKRLSLSVSKVQNVSLRKSVQHSQRVETLLPLLGWCVWLKWRETGRLTAFFVWQSISHLLSCRHSLSMESMRSGEWREWMREYEERLYVKATERAVRQAAGCSSLPIRLVSYKDSLWHRPLIDTLQSDHTQSDHTQSDHIQSDHIQSLHSVY